MLEGVPAHLLMDVAGDHMSDMSYLDYVCRQQFHPGLWHSWSQASHCALKGQAVLLIPFNVA